MTPKKRGHWKRGLGMWPALSAERRPTLFKCGSAMTDTLNLDPMIEEWVVHLAQNGDGSELAAVLRDHARSGTPVPKLILEYLADVLDGKVKPKRQKKL